MRDGNKTGIRAGQMLFNAEQKLWEALATYRKRGGNLESAIELVNLVFTSQIVDE